MRALAGFLGRTIAWVIILAAVGVIVAGVVVPRIAGATPYTIITGSMKPAYPPGTLVVVRPVDPNDLRTGDVVTVQLESGKETVVTHRIFEIQHRADGTSQFVTKGDANNSPDTEVRLPAQIRGELWYSIPYVGYVSNALTGPQRGWINSALVAGLAGFALWMFFGAARDRRRKQQTSRRRSTWVDAGTEPDDDAPLVHERIRTLIP